MAIQPQRKKRERMGVRQELRRIFDAHRGYIGDCLCVANDRPHMGACEGDVECAHIRIGEYRGAGLPPDYFAVPLCAHHHRGVQHATGEFTFWRRLGENPFHVARRFADRSTSPLLRRFLVENREAIDAEFARRAEIFEHKDVAA